MNEKIKELAHKVEFINKRHNGDEWRWGYIDPELSAKLEKFAELIVKECIYTIQGKIVRNGNTPENNRTYQHIEDLGNKFGITFPMNYFGGEE